MRNFVWFNVWFISCLNHLPAPFRHQPRCKHSIKTIIYSLTVEPVIHYKYEMEHNDILTPLVLQLLFLNNCFEMWHADRWVPPPPTPVPYFTQWEASLNEHASKCHHCNICDIFLTKNNNKGNFGILWQSSWSRRYIVTFWDVRKFSSYTQDGERVGRITINGGERKENHNKTLFFCLLPSVTRVDHLPPDPPQKHPLMSHRPSACPCSLHQLIFLFSYCLAAPSSTLFIFSISITLLCTCSNHLSLASSRLSANCSTWADVNVSAGHTYTHYYIFVLYTQIKGLVCIHLVWLTSPFLLSSPFTVR